MKFHVNISKANFVTFRRPVKTTAKLEAIITSLRKCSAGKAQRKKLMDWEKWKAYENDTRVRLSAFNAYTYMHILIVRNWENKYA